MDMQTAGVAVIVAAALCFMVRHLYRGARQGRCSCCGTGAGGRGRSRGSGCGCGCSMGKGGGGPCPAGGYTPVDDLGAELGPGQHTLGIGGMMCGQCEAHVKSALESVDGVQSVTASHERGTAVLLLNSAVPLRVLRDAVNGAGYEFQGVR